MPTLAVRACPDDPLGAACKTGHRMVTRRKSRIRFSVASARPDHERKPLLSWWIAALGGALLAALAGYLATAGVVVIGWLSAVSGSLGDAVHIGTQAWLLAHGVGAHIADTTVTLVPLGQTLLLGALMAGVAAFAAQQAALLIGQEEARAQGWRIVRNTGVLPGIVYGVLVTIGAMIGGQPSQVGPAAIGGLVLGVAAGALGAWLVVKPRLPQVLPTWAYVVPRAILIAVLVSLGSGAACVGAAFVAHLGRMQQIEDSLGGGVIGGLILLLLTLAYLPTIILWGVAYVFGAGFCVGVDSVVAPGGVQVGLLPALPVFGAVPSPGRQNPALFAWLATGAVAGIVAGALVVRARRRARADETALVGGLAGVAAGAAVTFLASLARGGMGVDRLADMGPRLAQLFVLSTTTMGIAGLAAGLILGLLRRPGVSAVAEAEHTRPVVRRSRADR